MKGIHKCEWLVLGKLEVCGKSCLGKYCRVHNAQIAKGGGTVPCEVCGIGVKTSLARCKDCGAGYARFKKWRNKNRIFKAEMKRLSAIEILN